MTALDAFSLAGKTAIVTGAGSGIGRAIALAFARAGAVVGCVDIDPAAAAATSDAIAAAHGRAVPLVCDVSREADTVAAAKARGGAFGAVHVLVNGAAATDPNGTVLDLTRADWDRVFAVNVTGAFLMSRAVLPAMIAAGGGSIIHIASQLGRVGGPARAVYCATKGALIQLAKAMATDHAAQNVRVNTLVARRGRDPAAGLPLRRHGDGAPRGRAQASPDAARPTRRDRQAAVFLASDASSFVTGVGPAGRRRVYGRVSVAKSIVIASEAKQSLFTCSCAPGRDCFVAHRNDRALHASFAHAKLAQWLARQIAEIGALLAMTWKE